MRQVVAARKSRPTPVTGVEGPEPFGPYLLIERIASGGMADVFKAVVTEGDGARRVMVIKRIRAELSGSPEFVRMFINEARITTMLDHPNIVQVTDFGEIDGMDFLAMEHLEGQDLGEVMRVVRRRRLALRASVAAHVALQVAHGLHYAHTLDDAEGRPLGIVHRDINPANVMLLHAGGVKVLDFGIAKATQMLARNETQHGKLKGKLAYLSPEQARGEPIDARSDIFSLGVTLWEMVTGRRLFAARSDLDRLNRVLHAPIAAPSTIRRAVPPALDAIVLRALERDRERRYSSADEMAAELEAFLATRQLKTDAVRRLLAALPREGGAAPPPLLTPGAIPIGTGTHTGTTASGPLLVPVSPLRAWGPRGLDLKPWIACAALVLAGAGAIFGLARTRAARSASMARTSATETAATKTPVAPVVTLIPPADNVHIRLESRPAGASVKLGAHAEGATPLTLVLPRSTSVQKLELSAEGFAPTTYDLLPEADGLIYLDLRRVARASDGLPGEPPHALVPHGGLAQVGAHAAGTHTRALKRAKRDRRLRRR